MRSSDGRPARRLSRRHLRAPALAFLACGGLVLAATRSWAYALGVALGPFAGGFAREWQSCCARNSFELAPFALAALAMGLASQLAVTTRYPLTRLFRRVVWPLSWAAWFVSALLSYAHALE